jgi:hypothetical protein
MLCTYPSRGLPTLAWHLIPSVSFFSISFPLESARSDRRIAQGRAARAAAGQARMFPFHSLSLSLKHIRSDMERLTKGGPSEERGAGSDRSLRTRGGGRSNCGRGQGACASGHQGAGRRGTIRFQRSLWLWMMTVLTDLAGRAVPQRNHGRCRVGRHGR